MLALHLAVLLFGLAGLFAKFLSVSPVILVWGRTFFSIFPLVLILLVHRQKIGPFSKGLGLSGMLLALHWLSFFWAIQVSTVAIGLLSFATFPIFLMLLEAIWGQDRLEAKDAGSVLLVVLGLVLVVPDFQWGGAAITGMLWGVISALTFALLTWFNRQHVQAHSGLVLATLQNGICCLITTPFVAGALADVSTHDWLGLLVLGLFCTALAHSLFIHALRTVKAKTAGLIVCLEPVYGMVLSYFLLQEKTALRTWLGALLILATSVGLTLRHQAFKPDQSIQV
ncbi:MAG: DMT family transporter [Acidobacteria bacterium]|nr:DMT family transporter [Acidobacteriota bacterium]MCB9398506.1 DMT family transporter [Acidobacteriota bacterium]